MLVYKVYYYDGKNTPTEYFTTNSYVAYTMYNMYKWECEETLKRILKERKRLDDLFDHYKIGISHNEANHDFRYGYAISFDESHFFDKYDPYFIWDGEEQTSVKRRYIATVGIPEEGTDETICETYVEMFDINVE